MTKMSKIVICNKCGKTLGDLDIQENFSIHSQLGYGMKYDGYELELDLCCKCMEQIIEGCQISPIVDNNITREDD
jgi:Fe2+ or Zn2+ uptake regulation protein